MFWSKTIQKGRLGYSSALGYLPLLCVQSVSGVLPMLWFIVVCSFIKREPYLLTQKYVVV